jgi:hypothetical protein
MEETRTPSHEKQQTAAELGLMQGSRPAHDRLVTLANWSDPPFDRWALQQMRELGPSASAARGDDPIADLPEDKRDLDQVTFGSALGSLRCVESEG